MKGQPMAELNELDTPEHELLEAQGLSDEMEVEEQADGSAVVSLPEDDEAQETPEFSANLAESLPETVLSRLGVDIAELIESDRESRAPRDKQYAEGIKRTGLGNEAPGGAEFVGASRAVHPMLAKGCVDFASRAIKELSPAAGPCKTQIVGETDDAKLDKAERKKSYMNWQMTTQVPEQRAEFERLLSQLPLGGSQYKRWWWDPVMERPRTETVYIDDVFLPYSQADFYTAYRVTHRQWVSAAEFDARMDSGLYRDIDSIAPGNAENQHSKSKTASEKVEGNEEDTTAYNDEGQREVYMSYIDLDLEGDDPMVSRTAPYIIHIENHSQKVLGLYRNWKEGDEKYAKKHWMVEYSFIPWRGAYGVGLYHLIGSLSVSGTGSLRALLDSAHISNFPGGLKLKGGRNSGQSVQVNATELAEIDAPAGVDDIRKMVMPFPFNGPSPVLFNLLEWITNQSEGMIATASEKIADAGANMPVGTALALIEHGSVNFSAIHARCHASLKRELEILHRLDAENMTDEETVEELGSLVVSRQDFQGPMDIIPVSDPNIFSEAQRYAQVQAVMQLAADPNFAPFFKKDRLLQRALRTLQVPSYDDLADLPKDPKRLGAVDENYLVCSPEPSPVKVYREQDDVAHLETHLHFLVSPMFGANPLIGPQAYPPLMPHIKDHMMSFYKKHAAAAADALEMVAPTAGAPITRAQAEAKGAAFADKIMAQLLGPMVMPALTQAQQLSQQFAQKPPLDPNVQAKIAGDQAIEQARGQSQQAIRKMELDDAERERQFKVSEAALERQTKLLIRDKELSEEHLQFMAEQEQNERATLAANQLGQRSIESSEQLAQFTADVKAADQQREAQLAERAAQIKTDNEAQMVVLTEMVKAQAARLQPQPLDVQGIVEPLIAAVQANSATMSQQLAQGLEALHASTKSPRIARYIRDEMGNTVGVESVVKE